MVMVVVMMVMRPTASCPVAARTTSRRTAAVLDRGGRCLRPRLLLLLLLLVLVAVLSPTATAFAGTAGVVRRPGAGGRRAGITTGTSSFRSRRSSRPPAASSLFRRAPRGRGQRPSRHRPSGSALLFPSGGGGGSETTAAAAEGEINFSEPEVARVEQFLQTLDAVAAAAAANQDNGDDKFSASSNSIDDNDDDELILQMLPQLPAGVLLKLRQAAATVDRSDPRIARAAARVGGALRRRWEAGRRTLQELLEAGELRKLDALIGRAAREHRLDAAFFNVLTANLEAAAAGRDGAAAAQESETATATTTTEEADDDDDDDDATTTNDGDDDTETPPSPAASRLQILRHVYTRCQEEVEKTIPAGTALLNKLLRTEQPAIRANLYRHYLAPPPTARTITTPDGKTVELKNDNNTEPSSLVPLADFIDAIQQAVLQIRQVEAAGGVDRVSAAGMVESLRGVAKEARFAVGQAYGGDSAELREFEEGLQPVFRPTSADSPYIAAGSSGTAEDADDGTNSANAAATSGGGAGTTNKSPDGEKDRDDDAVEQQQS